MPDHQMKFFTPDLYMRYNSPDDKIADQAEQDWEQAVENYNQHLAALPLRENVKTLSTQCFHDAFLLNKTTHPGFSPSVRYSIPSYTTILLQVSQSITLLTYVGADVFSVDCDPKWSQKSSGGDGKLWLYDEIDVAEDDPGRFIHRILWSDGTVLAIHFLDVSIVTIPLLHDRSQTNSTTKRERSLASAGDA